MKTKVNGIEIVFESNAVKANDIIKAAVDAGAMPRNITKYYDYKLVGYGGNTYSGHDMVRLDKSGDMITLSNAPTYIA